MNRIFINPDGSRHTPSQFCEDVRQEKQISLSNGAACSESILCSGFRYTQGHIDSFCQVYEAAGITMSPGQKISWRTESPDFEPSRIDPTAVNGAILVFEYAMGNGAPYPQPNGFFELSVDGEPLISFSMKKSNCLFEGKNGTRLYLEVHRKKAALHFGELFTLDEFVQNESLYVNGFAYLYLPQEIVAGRTSLTLSVDAHNQEAHSRRWFRVGFNYFTLAGDLSTGIEAVLATVRQRTIDGQTVYFGDIHVHTAQSEFLNGDGCGVGSVASNLTYARDVARLDFCAVTDHDWQLDARDWKTLRDTNDAFNENGRFVALNAFEWTSANYGHRNVYFRNGTEIPAALKPFDYQKEPYAPIKYGVSSPDDPTPEALWDWLENNRLEAITIPHHPNAEQFVMDFEKFYNEKFDRCVEVYSSWGCMFRTDHPLNLCSERIPGYAYSRYASSFHFGFVASSDGHDGNAGDANVTHDKHHLAHYAGSGHVAVFAENLSREAVYDALAARQCYAVTGELILLQFRIGTHSMGEVIASRSDSMPLFVHAVGTFPICQINLYQNGVLCQTLPVNGGEDVEYSGTLCPDACASYFVEVVQEDGECAWSSPISFCD